MDRRTNDKVLLWIGVIAVALILGANDTLASHIKYILIAATFIIAAGIFIAIVGQRR